MNSWWILAALGLLVLVYLAGNIHQNRSLLASNLAWILGRKQPEIAEAGSVRGSEIVGYYNMHDGKTRAAFNNLCLTKDPYYNENDVYYWWKYQPFYWQNKYQGCHKYGCGSRRGDCKNSGQEFEKAPNCASLKYAGYDSRGYGWTNRLFYENRAAFCYKYPDHIYCPNSFSGKCPNPDETFDTLGVA